MLYKVEMSGVHSFSACLARTPSTDVNKYPRKYAESTSSTVPGIPFVLSNTVYNCLPDGEYRVSLLYCPGVHDGLDGDAVRQPAPLPRLLVEGLPQVVLLRVGVGIGLHKTTQATTAQDIKFDAKSSKLKIF